MMEGQPTCASIVRMTASVRARTSMTVEGAEPVATIMMTIGTMKGGK